VWWWCLAVCPCRPRDAAKFLTRARSRAAAKGASAAQEVQEPLLNQSAWMISAQGLDSASVASHQSSWVVSSLSAQSSLRLTNPRTHLGHRRDSFPGTSHHRIRHSSHHCHDTATQMDNMSVRRTLQPKGPLGPPKKTPCPKTFASLPRPPRQTTSQGAQATTKQAASSPRTSLLTHTCHCTLDYLSMYSG